MLEFETARVMFLAVRSSFWETMALLRVDFGGHAQDANMAQLELH